MKTLIPLLALLSLLLLAGCTLFIPKEAGIGDPVSWDELSGWQEDNLSEAWPALLLQCQRLGKSQAPWNGLCETADALNQPSDSEIRDFFRTHFQPHEIIGKSSDVEGLITGYYEPILHGSLKPDDQFRYPLYGKPEEMLTIDIADLFPSLKGKRVRGRLVGNRVIPFYSRAEIDGDKTPLQGNELLWVNNPYDAFFLQVQGSGRATLPDGSSLKVGYADQNGHPYVSIGRRLIEMGEIPREQVSLFSIRDWLKTNPDRAQALLNNNPSYVFFTLAEDDGQGPRGSLNVPLTTQRSLAVDRSIIPLGTPIWLETSLPAHSSTEASTAYRRLFFAQDTGGAIKGPVRADIFFGRGKSAEWYAGNMQQPGRLFALIPKMDQKN